jgi:hypothetical protein
MPDEREQARDEHVETRPVGEMVEGSRSVDSVEFHPVYEVEPPPIGGLPPVETPQMSADPSADASGSGDSSSSTEE